MRLPTFALLTLLTSAGLLSAQDGAVMRPGDTFEMRLSGMPMEDAQSFNLQYNVSSDGFINVPLVGQIRAAGLSQSQVQQAIERKLVADKIFTRPTAAIAMAQSRYVTVGGNVRAPQRLGWAPDLTLMSAIMSAGGAGDFGGDKVNLVRSGQVQQYRIKRMKANPSEDPRLLPGDQIDLQ